MVAYPSGFVAQYNYAPTYGYLAEVKDANSTQIYWTANAYDAEMHLTQQTAGNGVVTNQTCDANTGFLTAIQAGLPATPNTVANFSYGYDQLSNLTARADVNTGLSESFTYDPLNRLTQYQVIGGTTRTVIIGHELGHFRGGDAAYRYCRTAIQDDLQTSRRNSSLVKTRITRIIRASQSKGCPPCRQSVPSNSSASSANSSTRRSASRWRSPGTGGASSC
jgi:hypothetical protein